MRIAFVVQYPKGTSPGQRFRLELWEGVLRQAGIEHDTFPFLDQTTHSILFAKGRVFQKVRGVALGLLRRLFLVFRLRDFDYVMVQREMAPVGPPVLEWLASKVVGAKLIVDFDDAIWLPASSEENRLAAPLRCSWKAGYLCKWAYKVSVGNAYLAEYARQFNSQTSIIPTCVDTALSAGHQRQHRKGRSLVVGWTGSFSTLKYLDQILPALRRAQREVPFVFLVIADRKPELPGLDTRFVPWAKWSEVEDVAQMDVGVMPLPQDAWSRGKCGFKLIQYLAVGVPAIASPVGVNPEIIEEGVSGFLCDNEDAWVDALLRLLTNPALRAEMGQAGRRRVVERYSVVANHQAFLGLFS